MRLRILLCAAFAATSAAQVPQPGATQPVFRTGTRVVEVSVRATRANGSAVEDLTREELELLDNNQVQAIGTFERVENRAAGTKESQRAVGTGHPAQRFSVLLLDGLNTSWSDQIYARWAATRALEQIPAGERVAIFALGNGLRLLHDFSSDSAALRALIQKFSGAIPQDQLESSAGSSAAEFSYSDLTRPREPLAGPFAAFRQRQRILETLQALTAIAHLLAKFPGQKNLLWLSAGFPLRIGDASSSESLHDEAAKTTRDLNAANVTIYPIDARGLSLSPNAYINVNTMKELADQTGGKAYYNSNDLASMVRSALDDSGTGYVLTYAPANLRDDGKYHRLHLRTPRKGVVLRYRPGYYDDTTRSVGREKPAPAR
jgi:VWFA-related protein